MTQQQYNEAVNDKLLQLGFFDIDAKARKEFGVGEDNNIVEEKTAEFIELAYRINMPIEEAASRIYMSAYLAYETVKLLMTNQPKVKES